MVLFETKEFRSYDVTEAYTAKGINEKELRFALFKDFIITYNQEEEVFIREDEISTRDAEVFKLDLSFIDEMKVPTLIPLPDVRGIMFIADIVSIQ